MYRETSRDVADRAGLRDDAVVVDLCCGTGITTETILESLGPAGRVTGVDASEAMLSRTPCARATWSLTNPSSSPTT